MTLNRESTDNIGNTLEFKARPPDNWVVSLSSDSQQLFVLSIALPLMTFIVAKLFQSRMTEVLWRLIAININKFIPFA